MILAVNKKIGCNEVNILILVKRTLGKPAKDIRLTYGLKTDLTFRIGKKKAVKFTLPPFRYLKLNYSFSQFIVWRSSSSSIVIVHPSLEI
jgi:hypothetical protein